MKTKFKVELRIVFESGFIDRSFDVLVETLSKITPDNLRDARISGVQAVDFFWKYLTHSDTLKQIAKYTAPAKNSNSMMRPSRSPML
jgi:hypothetical protein